MTDGAVLRFDHEHPPDRVLFVGPDFDVEATAVLELVDVESVDHVDVTITTDASRAWYFTLDVGRSSSTQLGATCTKMIVVPPYGLPACYDL